MAKKYVNFRVGGVPERKDEDYTVWTNDLLSKLIASKTVVDPCRSTYGHRLLESEVVYVVISGRGTMEIVEYTNTEEGHGHDPFQVLPLASLRHGSIAFWAPNGEVAGCGGIGTQGDIWMLCTPVIHIYPISFARSAKRYLEGRSEKLLWNICDKRNTVHLRLLQYLGFKFLREFTYGPNKLTFIEFCRV